MLNKDGTGSNGAGPKTGRGLGPCGDGAPRGGGQGLNRGQGRKLRMGRRSENEN